MSEKMTDEQLVEQLFEPATPEEEPEAVEETPEQESEAEVEEEAEEELDEEAEAEDPEEDDEEAEADEESEDDEDEEDPDDDEESDELYTVKVDGEEKQVNLEELRRGYSGQEYIRKGMQEVADQRRDIEAAEGKIREYAQTMQQERQALMQLAKQAQTEGLMPKPQEPSREMFEADPIGYMQAEIDYKDQLKAYDEQQRQIQWHEQQAQQAQQQERQQLLEQNKQRLFETIPEFRDAEKAPKLVEELTKFAMDQYGYSREEINANIDARRVKEIYDLHQFHKMKTGKEAAKKPRQPLKSIKKSTGNTAAGKKLQRRKQLEKAKKTQSTEDFVDLLFQN